MSYRHQVAPDANPQTVSISGSSAQSSALGTTTNAVRLCADTDCFILIGANPVATNAKVYLPAKVPQVFACSPGQKVAVIGTSGILYITEANSVQ